MDEKPIAEEKPVETAQIPPVINEIPQVIDEIPPKQPQEGQVIDTPVNSIPPHTMQQTTSEITQKVIRKKMKYGQFVKMVKAGKFISANLTAKILGVTRETIGEWIRTPKVQKAIEEKISSLVEKMETAGQNDWRAYDRLIQYALNEEKQGAGPTTQILIVNNDKEFRIQTG